MGVDNETGKIDLKKYFTVADVGKAIHPLQCEGQDEGAAIANAVAWSMGVRIKELPRLPNGSGGRSIRREKLASDGMRASRPNRTPKHKFGGQTKTSKTSSPTIPSDRKTSSILRR
ncbi:MAG: molybdopterin cofactor-binding domain-containing protein [Candidatus Binatia bacterium]